ncbi:hypothetical protein [Evansella cellulosilytica]|uniref:DUF5673 domain-containing protein n=1 Tax=Evansella cellulosilytica (strain ATCC 21833 / DSM 2522 / FERM P-1141 / JCM 9156 / N-4) TaxID=649639 RepID=E6TY88_EVAC2|nr:hypothetical protein [Evansella cellulosilytica]ADU32407.1 hypothetical protein Bcell_4180 [Evansella cellulosilytica DSM 2522]
MTLEIFILVLVFGFFLWILTSFIKSKNRFQLVKKALYPTQEGTDIVTRSGKIESLSFNSRKWKQRLWLFILSILIITVFVIFSINSENLDWFNVLPLFNIPILLLISTKLASFYIINSGILLDESFFAWEELKGYKTAPLRMGHDMYGMFDNSAQYTEVEFFLAKTKNSVSIFVRDEDEVNRIHRLLKSNGLEEMNSDNKKEQIQ